MENVHEEIPVVVTALDVHNVNTLPWTILCELDQPSQMPSCHDVEEVETHEQKDVENQTTLNTDELSWMEYNNVDFTLLLDTSDTGKLRCEECNKRNVIFRCHQCDLSLCFLCTDAIHIIPSFAKHTISIFESTAVAVTDTQDDVATVFPPPAIVPVQLSPRDPIPPSCILSVYTPSTQIEHRLHLPTGTKLFFRSIDCARWAQELLHGFVVSMDHGVRSNRQSESDAIAYYYRILWIRGIEILENGFYRANLVLPAPYWPIELGLYPSLLAAFRAVITAEKLARAKYRRERVSGRFEKNIFDFPSDTIIDEIRQEMDVILSHEFRTRLTQAEDAAFFQAIGKGTWDYRQWIKEIGREDDLREEQAATEEQCNQMIESGLQLPWTTERNRFRYFLIEQRDLILPDVVRRAHVKKILQQMMELYVGFAWRRWLTFVKRHRRHEIETRRVNAAIEIQRWIRRIHCHAIQRELAMGSPLTSSLKAMDYYRRRQVHAIKIYNMLVQQCEAKQRNALHTWAKHANIFDPIVRQRYAPPVRTNWHSSHGITSLPRLPRIYAHKRNDGSLGIDDHKLYKQFRANHAGPTDTSYWVIKGRILAGVYPAGQRTFTDARRTLSRTDCITSLLLEGINCFVCLATVHELEKHEQTIDSACLEDSVSPLKLNGPSSTLENQWLFERIVRAKQEILEMELSNALKMSRRQLELAENELEDLLDPRPGTKAITVKEENLVDYQAHREILLNKIELARQNEHKTIETLKHVTHTLSFLHCPIPKDSVPESREAIESLVVSIEDRLRFQHTIYIFSMDGHGRTGFVAALLLGRLYGISSLEALERAQRLHDCQTAMHNVPSTRFISSPKATPQIEMVKQLLAYKNDAIYAPIVTENTTDRYYTWRTQQRGIPIEKFTTRDGFMISDRVDEATMLEQQRVHQRMLRIGKRESAASLLLYERERQRGEAHLMNQQEKETREYLTQEQVVMTEVVMTLAKVMDAVVEKDPHS